MKQSLVIILPVYNEADSIIALHKELLTVSKSLSKQYSVHFLWIDDGSTDRSWSILQSLAQEAGSTTRILRLITNFGKTSAIAAGLAHASEDVIAILDTDLQDNPLHLTAMLDILHDKQADFVIGNRTNRYKKQPLKRISSFLIRSIVSLLFPKLLIQDINCGMKVFTRQVAQSLYLKSDYHRYIPLIAHLKGFTVTQVPVIQRKRVHGYSKYGTTGFMRTWKSFSDLLSIVFLYRLAVNPFSFFGKLGLFSIVIGCIILGYLTVEWFLGNAINARPLFFLGVLAVTTGVNFLSLGLIGDMILQTDRTPQYIVQET